MAGNNCGVGYKYSYTLHQYDGGDGHDGDDHDGGDRDDGDPGHDGLCLLELKWNITKSKSSCD